MTSDTAQESILDALTPKIDPVLFRSMTSLIYDKAGIKLGPEKEALVASRVGKRMRQLKIGNIADYWNALEADSTGRELAELLNVISTNVTEFFREPKHFEFLAEVLKRWQAEGQRTFRLWSAAASSGQEPYSVAMTVLDSLDNTFDTKILATDISTKVLAAARLGEYDERGMNGLPAAMRARYVEVVKTGSHNRDDARFRVADNVRRLVKFARLNLSQPPFPMKGPFDVIFCRNVMIYFDNAVRLRLLSELYRLVKKGGYLIVGHAESLSGMLSQFKVVEPSVFVKN